jgi:hypothetical protein
VEHGAVFRVAHAIDEQEHAFVILVEKRSEVAAPRLAPEWPTGNGSSIPAVCAAAPGLMSMLDLPLITGRGLRRA